jgi:hypothetical protein
LLNGTLSKRRKPVAELKPHECGGPFVQCDADLWLLLWGQNYAPVCQATDRLGLDIFTALLLERDAASMQANSIASAIRHIWIYVWTLSKSYSAALKLEARRQAMRAGAARAKSAITRTEAKKERDAQVRQLAADLWKREPGLEPKEMGARIHALVTNGKGFEKSTPASITKKLGGVRRKVLRAVNTSR